MAQENGDASQSADSLQKAKEIRKKNYSRPRKASLMSTFVPGLGQVYNKKYWKVPIIYGALAGFGYIFSVNNERYNYFRKNLIADNDDDPSTINTSGYSSDNLQLLKKAREKNRNLSGAAIVFVYILNIIDANVDAHLRTFDVSNDVSIRLEPWQQNYPYGLGRCTAVGLSLKLNFK
jgi:hypothetical protein